MHQRIFLAFVIALGVPAVTQADFVTTFEIPGLPVGTFNNNAGPGGQFLINGNGYNNSYTKDPVFGDLWYGWARSSMTDSTTGDFTNQYSAIPGHGADDSANYMVAFTFGPVSDFKNPDGSYIDLAEGAAPLSLDVTNTTYAYFTMRDGNSFSHAFGAGDYFLLQVKGYDALGGTGSLVGEVDFYLANFLNGNSSIVDSWTSLDLSSLAGARSLRFGVLSSDTGPDGINTPAYFAIDNFRFARPVPEPRTVVLLLTGVLTLGGCRLRKRRRLKTIGKV